MLDHLPPKTKNKVIMTVLLSTIVGGILGNIYIQARLKEIAKLKYEKENHSKKDGLLRELNSSEKRLIDYRKRLAETKEVSWLIEELNRMASESGFTLTEANPGMTETKGDYEKASLNVEATCDYHQLGDFVSRIENSTRFIKISNLQLEKWAGGQEVGTKLSMTVSIFYSKVGL